MGDTYLDLSWTPGSGNGLALTSQEIEAALDAGFATVTASQSASGVATAHRLSGLSNDVLHYVRVRGVHGGGAGPWSASVTGTPTGSSVGYNLATAGAMTPGNGISGYTPPAGDLGQFFDNLNPPWDVAPTFDQLRLAPNSGWVRTIHVGPTATGSQSGLSASDKCSAQQWEDRLNGQAANPNSFGTPGDFFLFYDGNHGLETYKSGAIPKRILGVHGTAANPIRMISETVHGARLYSTYAGDPLGTDVLGWTDCSYWGIHGFEVDGRGIPAGTWCTWGLNPGVKGDLPANDVRINDPNCHHFDIWHCEIHDVGQEGLHFGSTRQQATQSRDAHAHGNWIHHTGLKASAGNFYGEGIYWGSGSGWNGVDTTGPNGLVDNAVADWNLIEDVNRGEAIDHKGAATGARDLHNMVRRITHGFQAVISTDDDLVSWEVGWNIGYDLKNVETGFAVAMIHATNGSWVHNNVGWDIETSLIGHHGRGNAAAPLFEENTVGLAVPSGFYATSGTGQITPTYTNNLSMDSSANTTDGDPADFVNAEGAAGDSDVVGRAGVGMQLASGSAIAATIGAMGKAS